MAPSRREGLRILLKRTEPDENESTGKKKISNAVHCKAYRERKKNCPDYIENNKEKCRKYRNRVLTEEQLAARREASRLRTQKCREAKRRMEPLTSTPKPSSKTKDKPKTRKAVEHQRQTWRLQKSKQRDSWTSQKWRRHREKCKAYSQSKRDLARVSDQNNCHSEGNILKAPELTQKDACHVAEPIRCHLSPERNSLDTQEHEQRDSCNIAEPISCHLSPERNSIDNQEHGQRDSCEIPESASCHLSPERNGIDNQDHGQTDSCDIAESAMSQSMESEANGTTPLEAAIRARSIQKAKLLSPSPSHLKTAYKEKIQQLQPLRSKTALAKKRLLFELVLGVNDEDRAANLYKRRKINPVTTDAVDFLEENAICIPDKKAVSKQTGMVKKILPKRLKTLHKEFLTKNLGKISLRTLFRKKPAHIVTSRNRVFQQCLCEICTNVDLKLDAFNQHLNSKFEGHDSLSEASLCPEPTDLCYDRKCENCGVRTVKFSFSTRLDTVVSWKEWDMVEKENHKKRKELVAKNGTLQELTDEVLKDLSALAKHLHIFRWQYHQYRYLKLNLPATWALSVIDFAENFLCKNQMEVQSAHWAYSQVTVHPCVSFYACENCQAQVTDYLIFLSDDLSHDAHIAHLFLKRTREHLRSKMHHLQKMVVYSDGCGAHYKSKVPFFYLTQDNDQVVLERCYFGSRHGKSQCDSAGGVIKRLVEEDIKNGAVVQNASDMFRHCSEHFVLAQEDPATCCHTRRSFQLVKPDEVVRDVSAASLQTLPGTRQIHSLKRLSDRTLATRAKSCFCQSCIAALPCENKIPWTTVKFSSNRGLSKQPANQNIENVPPPSPLSRVQFFDQLLLQLGCCDSFSDLVLLAKASQATVLGYVFPNERPSSVVDLQAGFSDLAIDKCAEELKPPTIRNLLFPIKTIADGNCLPRSLSTLVFGSQDNHVEMRCRIVMELAMRKAAYIHGEGMGGLDVAAKVAALSDRASNVEITPTDVPQINEVFEREVRDVAFKGIPMGLWQIAAASNVMGMPIRSVYPDKGWFEGNLLNRTLVPHTHCDHNNILHVMWSSTRDDMPASHWVANHFVPLLPMTVTALESINDSIMNKAFLTQDVEENDFYRVGWEGKDYIAQVKEVDSEVKQVRLSFLEKRNSLYVWPVKEDLSWEHFDVLGEKVSLELDVTNSNQRLQYFKLSN